VDKQAGRAGQTALPAFPLADVRLAHSVDAIRSFWRIKMRQNDVFRP
jgi:hypothetical protein